MIKAQTPASVNLERSEMTAHFEREIVSFRYYGKIVAGLFLEDAIQFAEAVMAFAAQQQDMEEDDLAEMFRTRLPQDELPTETAARIDEDMSATLEDLRAGRVEPLVSFSDGDGDPDGYDVGEYEYLNRWQW